MSQTPVPQTSGAQGDADLRALVSTLIERVRTLEGEVADLRAAQAVPEDVVVAIGAAVAAFLGHKARVRSIRLSGGGRWATEKRSLAHTHVVPRAR